MENSISLTKKTKKALFVCNACRAKHYSLKTSAYDVPIVPDTLIIGKKPNGEHYFQCVSCKDAQRLNAISNKIQYALNVMNSIMYE